jgi:uncharacterized protein (TIGR02453 family)
MFPDGLFTFLRDLAAHNERAWFNGNKDRYREVLLEPSLDFVEAFGPRLRKISRHLVADPRPVGGSLFRIYRDTRFSPDKSPYKTHVGIHFRHASAKDVHAPGFYLHLEPKEIFAAAGIYRPDTATANRVRDTIARTGAAWRRAAHGKPFTGTWRLGGDALKRAPSGVAADHPLIEDLKRKDFIGTATLTRKDVTSDRFLARFGTMCAAGAPLMRFLCDALDLPF